MDERMNVRMYVRMITYVCTYVPMYVCTYVYIKIYVCVCVNLYNYIGLCINVHMQSYVYIDRYIYNKIHTYIYTQQIRHTAMEDGFVPFPISSHPPGPSWSTILHIRYPDFAACTTIRHNALSPQLPSESTPQLGTPILCLMVPRWHLGCWSIEKQLARARASG